jgi:VWFA-related protein
MPGLPLACCLALLCCVSTQQLLSQADRDAQSGYRLRTNARVVLTDVTVLDKYGKPVLGLKASDFRVFDNNKPQAIDSFEEHTRSSAPSAPVLPDPSDGNSNDYLAHPPQVLNVIFIDLTNIEIGDQMYLSYQLAKFFDSLKPDESVAIYARPGDATVLLQGFTSDHALLRAAVRKLLPRLPPPGREYLDDFQTLHQIAAYLEQIPGRKDVLWLSGGSGGSMLFGIAGGTALVNDAEWRAIYDELETNRIAIYPIDVRGEVLSGYSVNTHGQTTARPQTTVNDQHALMNNVAEATGGRAVYSNNGIAGSVADIVDKDAQYYTLTYNPSHLAYDNRWHKVHVTIPGSNYKLSYRRGYYAEGPASPEQPSSRTRLRAGGTTEVTLTDHRPIIFHARIYAGMPTNSPSLHPQHALHRGMAAYTVESSLPLDAFTIKSDGGKWKVACGLEMIALNSNGSVVSQVSKKIAFTLREEAAQHPLGQELPLEEEIDLPKGDLYVYVAIADAGSRRLGALEIPYHAEPPRPH